MEEKEKVKSGPLDKAVNQFVDAVMKNVEEGYDNPLLPFDSYVEKTKLEVKKDVMEFRLRLRKGYLALLYAIRDKKGLSKEEKKDLVREILTRQVNHLSGDFRIYP